LRSKASTGVGTIELTIDDILHKVELRRSPSGVTVSCSTLGLIEQGTKLVLGFPALRGVSVQQTSNPTRSATPRPGLEDVAPLITATVDARLDDLRQWLINVDSQGLTHLLDRFFQVVSDFLPGTPVSFSRVSETKDVLVNAAGEEVPIEQLSQGMSSLLAWVGVLLERLTEIYGGDLSALDQPALLLVDELDAHLHPEWQRKLVPIIRQHFPNLQMIATTHSPLIVSALERDSVIAIGREDGEILYRKAGEELLGLRTDQVLTSDLFGLDTTRSVAYAEKADELDALIARDDLTVSEEHTRDILFNELDAITVPGDTARAREEFRMRRAEATHADIDRESAERGARIIDALLADEEPS
jgi:ABC-type multidrug transport system ATPase subunit